MGNRKPLSSIYNLTSSLRDLSNWNHLAPLLLLVESGITWPLHVFQLIKTLCRQHNSLILRPLESKKFIKVLMSFLLFSLQKCISREYTISFTKQVSFWMYLPATYAFPLFLRSENNWDRIYLTVKLFLLTLPCYFGRFPLFALFSITFFMATLIMRLLLTLELLFVSIKILNYLNLKFWII